jgi:hypothetical protein
MWASILFHSSKRSATYFPTTDKPRSIGLCQKRNKLHTITLYVVHICSFILQTRFHVTQSPNFHPRDLLWVDVKLLLDLIVMYYLLHFNTLLHFVGSLVVCRKRLESWIPLQFVILLSWCFLQLLIPSNLHPVYISHSIDLGPDICVGLWDTILA